MLPLLDPATTAFVSITLSVLVVLWFGMTVALLVCRDRGY